MEKIAIITDSCSDIKKEYRELYDIHVLPIQIQYDGKSYRDGVDITSNDIYAIFSIYITLKLFWTSY